MADRNGSGDGKKVEIDFRAHEMQIDSEIDTQSVRNSQGAGAGPEAAEISTQNAAPAGHLANPAPSAEKGGGIDLDALQLEIDREIDTLFTPAARPASAKPAVDTHAGRDEASPAAAPLKAVKIPTGSAAPAVSLPESAPSAEKRSGLDLDALQLEIDREIDTLFTPAAKPAARTGPVPDEALPAAAHRAKPASEKPRHASVRPPAVGPGAEDVAPYHQAGVKSMYPSRAELPSLVEAFNAAYLSLDWDFSAENVRKLDAALRDLEPLSEKIPGSEPIFKILKAVLALLHVRPQSANSQIVELIRDAQGLLAHILLMEDGLGPPEKARLRALVGRFRSMRAKALSAREARAARGARPEPPAVPDVSPGKKAAEEVSVLERMPDRWSLRDLAAWMESTGQTLLQNLAGIDVEMERIRQMEQALGKTSSLALVVERLKSIRGGVESRVSALRGGQGEWLDRVGWVESLQKVADAGEIRREKAAEPEAAVPGPTGDPAVAEPAETRRESVYLFHVAGKAVAVVSPCVVAVRLASKKKMKSILKQGGATLADLRPSFRTVKWGVVGEWAKMPRKVLKSYGFETFGLEGDEVAEPIPYPRNAVFASNGYSHGILFADPGKVELIEDAEITREKCKGRAPFETVRTESGLGAELVDLDRIFPQNPA